MNDDGNPDSRVENILASKRPSVHRLCYGCFLQEPLYLNDGILAWAIPELGLPHAIDSMAAYGAFVLGSGLSTKQIEQMQTDAEKRVPAVSLVYFAQQDGTPEELERVSASPLERAEQLLSWVTGDWVEPFATIIAPTGIETRVQPIFPSSRRRMRLGFGNTGKDIAGSIQRVSAVIASDERLQFCLSLFRDAMHERNPQFKIARLFNVLEALAAPLKTKGIGSRQAVRLMVHGTPDPVESYYYLGQKEIVYDTIELAGRLRDKLFHGTRFSRQDPDEKPAGQL